MNDPTPSQELFTTRLISKVSIRMTRYGFLDALIDKYPKKEAADRIYNFFASLREIMIEELGDADV